MILYVLGVNFLTWPQNKTFDIGSSFTLSCSADNDATSIDWTRGEGTDPKVIFATVTGKIGTNSSDFEWKRPNSRTVDLVVNNATSEYADVYCCQLNNGEGPKECAYVMENPGGMLVAFQFM